MAYVFNTPHGCVISKPEKQQQIALNLSEWMGLSQIHEKITAFMTGVSRDTSQYWNLPHANARGGSVDVRVTLSSFEGNCYTNIRVYVDGKPCKQGVTLNASNWASIQTSLGYSAEATLGREVYTHMLRELLAETMRSGCMGCEKGWGGQKDHDCLRDPGQTLRTLTPVDAHEYIVTLALKAKEKRHVLERPLECYVLCHNFLREDIEKELLSETSNYAS